MRVIRASVSKDTPAYIFVTIFNTLPLWYDNLTQAVVAMMQCLATRGIFCYCCFFSFYSSLQIDLNRNLIYFEIMTCAHARTKQGCFVAFTGSENKFGANLYFFDFIEFLTIF